MKPLKFYTTLKLIREKHPCRSGWGTLLNTLGKSRPDNVRLSFATILRSNGVLDTLWALRAVPPHLEAGRDVVCRLLAVAFAYRVLPNYERANPGDIRPRKAIETARLYAQGRATAAELRQAHRKARDAANSAADWGAYCEADTAARSAADWGAYCVADSAARSAADWGAYCEADSVARSAADWGAYCEAYCEARRAAYSAACSVEREWQKDAMLEAFRNIERELSK